MPPTIPATILLIDDSQDDRHTYMSFLKASRDGLYTFLEASDAEEGLRICRQTQLDCIILDFELPDMSGLEFLGRLAKECTDEHPPVIMVTGRGSETVAVTALKAGAFDYLIKKDVSAQTVFRATHNALEVNQLNRSLSQEVKDREGAEADLRESEARYRMLVESVRDYAIMMLDADAKIISWNAGARKLFGYHDEEVLSQHVRRLYPVNFERYQRVIRELEEAKTNGSCTANGLLLRKDGTYFWGVGSISPVHDRWGRLCGFSKVVRRSEEDSVADGALSDKSEVNLDKLAQSMTTSLDVLEAASGQAIGWEEKSIETLRKNFKEMRSAVDILRENQQKATLETPRADKSSRKDERG